MGRLTCDGPFMPIPVTARQGPTMVQQLDEILSSADQMPVVVLNNLQMLIHLFTGQSSEGSVHEVKAQGHLICRLGRLLFH